MADSKVSEMGSTKFFIVAAATIMVATLVTNEIQKRIDS